MRRLTDQERVALREVGPPGEGPVNDATFAELESLGWGHWVAVVLPDGSRDSEWVVTEAGRRALELDDAARGAS